MLINLIFPIWNQMNPATKRSANHRMIQVSVSKTLNKTETTFSIKQIKETLIGMKRHAHSKFSVGPAAYAVVSAEVSTFANWNPASASTWSSTLATCPGMTQSFLKIVSVNLSHDLNNLELFRRFLFQIKHFWQEFCHEILAALEFLQF